MVEQTIENFISIAEKKRNFGMKSPLKYFILSMMAGMYVGFGIILIFSIGAPLKAIDAAVIKAIMGASFGIALTLVVFAGSELFTGNNMIFTIASLEKKMSWTDTLYLWTICFFGNLVGSLLLAYMFSLSGLAENKLTMEFIAATASAKEHAPFTQLFFRGILCNMLVCLAVWTAARTTHDSAKILLIFWCLFAFIGSGFEHSIANMTLLGIDLFLPGHMTFETIKLIIANLIPVTLGNIVGGAILIGGAYWYVAHTFAEKERVAQHGKTTDIERIRSSN